LKGDIVINFGRKMTLLTKILTLSFCILVFVIFLICF